MPNTLIDWTCELCHYDENPQHAESCAACGYGSSQDMKISDWLENQGLGTIGVAKKPQN
jgi:ribosomal protein L37E